MIVEAIVSWWQLLPWSTALMVLAIVASLITVFAIRRADRENQPVYQEIRAILRRERREKSRRRRLLIRSLRKALASCWRVTPDRNYSTGQFSVGRDVKNLFLH